MSKCEIQIICGKDFEVFCDDVSMGISTEEEDGKYLRDLSPGKHVICLTKEGEIPATFDVELINGEILELDVSKSVKKMIIEDNKPEFNIRQVVGSLKIHTVPMKCEIEFLSEKFVKESPTSVIHNIAVGNYPIIFRKNEIELKDEVSIKKNVILEITADFLNKQIVDVTSEFKLRNRPSVICFKQWEKLSDYSKKFMFDPSLKSIETMLVGFSHNDTNIVKDVPITVKNNQGQTIEKTRNSFTILPDIKPPIFIFVTPADYKILIERDVQRFVDKRLTPGMLYEMTFGEHYEIALNEVREDFIKKDAYQLDRDGFYH